LSKSNFWVSTVSEVFTAARYMELVLLNGGVEPDICRVSNWRA
jgi:hypothetical protein